MASRHRCAAPRSQSDRTLQRGCGRQGNTALIAFLHIALGSASELEFQLALTKELEIGATEAREEAMDQAARTARMLSRLIATLRDRPEVHR